MFIAYLFTLRVFVAPAASQPSENLFPESAAPSFFPESAAPSFFPESTPGPPPAPAAAPKSNLGGLEDLFGDVSFGAAPAPAPAPAQAPPATATATNFPNSQVDKRLIPKDRVTQISRHAFSSI